MFYLYLIFRNLTINATKIELWLLPNIFTLILFVIIFGINFGKEENNRFIRYTYFFVSLLMILGVGKVVLLRDIDRLAVFGGPNGYYKFAMLFEAMSFCLLITTKKKRYIPGILAGVALALLTGSKGAFVELAFIIPIELIYFFYLKGFNIFKILFRLFVILAILIGLFYLSWLFLPKDSAIWISIDRIWGIFGENFSELTSVSSRKVMLDLSIDYFKESPVFGRGGLHMLISTGNEDMPYAHNIFYEMLGEQGMIGFVLLVFVLVRELRCLKKETLYDPMAFSLFLGFLIYFIGAQLSGNILDSKVIFFFILMHIKRLEVFKKDNSVCRMIHQRAVL